MRVTGQQGVRSTGQGVPRRRAGGSLHGLGMHHRAAQEMLTPPDEKEQKEKREKRENRREGKRERENEEKKKEKEKKEFYWCHVHVFSTQQPGSPTVLRTLHTLPWQDPHPGTPTWHPARQPPFLCHLRPLTDLPNSSLTPLGRGPPAALQEPPGQPQEPSPPSDAAKFSLCTCTQGFPGRDSQLCRRPPPCRDRWAAFTVSGQSSERPWPQSLEDQE